MRSGRGKLPPKAAAWELLLPHIHTLVSEQRKLTRMELLILKEAGYKDMILKKVTHLIPVPQNTLGKTKLKD